MTPGQRAEIQRQLFPATQPAKPGGENTIATKEARDAAAQYLADRAKDSKNILRDEDGYG